MTSLIPISRFGRAQSLRMVCVFLLALACLAIAVTPARAQTTPDSNPVPMLAYYYIWYTPGSWDRAKNDFPLLGRYSSDDEQVMRQQVEWAKQAGITGFIVSWKNTKVLTPRLEQLIKIARVENFKLAIIYQGLDFDRNPVPTSQVAADLDFFAAHWGNDPVFSIFDHPLVIWSGTWKYATSQIKSVTMGRRTDLLILASERRASDYERLSQYVDGNAYYWSSVNPSTFPGYLDKLTGMSDLVHADHGIWIAPVAPGFDARDIGGTTTVARNGGDTLRTEFDTASKSNPDAIGLISWNEFSENTYVEPSNSYGDHYLTLVAQLNHAPPLTIPDFDSSEPASTSFRFDHLSIIGGFFLLFVGSIAVIIRREKHGSNNNESNLSNLDSPDNNTDSRDD